MNKFFEWPFLIVQKYLLIMNWSMERIIPQSLLGDGQRLRLMKEYLKQLKEQKSIKSKKA
ncbi:hypothetical protein SAMN00777080_0622 [Aquiflexum balticum DSM 16537]|jgi:hypothetical protein|uniref:Uncharacterized protein n=1 Tax=Aquiflexum balticum DSM 16537 TaxID=758820 RepID=A0A1W2GZF4_9BACT|nr:hypothetical protein SAMN00777080_0622 [Aquiflexum balticum DSM 16537]